MIDHSNSFNEFLENNLNTEQKKAVKANSGVFLVVAGAGSGKTRIITSRIANLIINQNADPNSIVALTFTNKAAKEMSYRITQFLEPGSQLPFLGTFHSYCLKILRNNADLLENPFVSILDDDDQQRSLKILIKQYSIGTRITAKKISYNISQIKNNLLFKKDDISLPLAQESFIKNIYAAYEKEKLASKCLDFDDLLIEVVKLFEKNPAFKKQFQKQIEHILVDEYQDTNMVQHALLKNMTLSKNKKFKAKSLCIVGDEDQSIYSWRGATIENIINFKKDFPETKLIKIEQNYRSVQPILDAANKVIKNNKNRNEKKLWSKKRGSNAIKSISCLSEYQEGDIVSQFLKTASKKQNLSSTAILYRAHYQSRAIEEALIRNAIPYKIIGGIQFYERKEIKDILAYLRLAANPFDRAAFFRVINCPTRGLGIKFEELFYNKWNQELLSNFKIISKALLKDKSLTQTKKASLINFLHLFNNLDSQTSPSSAIVQIITATGYLTYLKNSYEKQEAETRIANVKELIRAIKHMEEQESKTISQFLDEVALMQEATSKSQEEKQDSVTLMTLHAAKGLEFDTILIVGLEEGLLPISRAMFDTQAVEEERRLFYVGITRAKKRLLLTFSNYRYAFGQTNYQAPSRFLKEIPQNLLSPIDCSRFNQHQIDIIFSQWLGIEIPKKEHSIFTFARLRQGFDGLPAGQAKANKGPWRKNQPVQHKKFGIGIVQKIEEKSENIIYITAKFKAGIKKVDSKFLSLI